MISFLIPHYKWLQIFHFVCGRLWIKNWISCNHHKGRQSFQYFTDEETDILLSIWANKDSILGHSDVKSNTFKH